MKPGKFLIMTAVLALTVFLSGKMYYKAHEYERNEVQNKEGTQEEKGERISFDARIQSLETVNLLVMGLDDEEVRSDTMLFLNYSPEYKKLNVLSIARDTRVKVRGRMEKINALVGIGGISLAVKGAEQLTGMKVNYYTVLNFAAFRRIIDELGGVEFDVPFDMNYDDPLQNLHIHLSKGKQILDGSRAEQLVRYRKGNRNGEGYEDGDIGRSKMQQQFIKAFIEQKTKFSYLTKADDVFMLLRKNLKTNIQIADLAAYVKYLNNMGQTEVNSYTLPGEATYIDNLWYYICDKEATRKLIAGKFCR